MTPYVSFVLTSRNDDYAGGQLRRMEHSLNCLIRQLRDCVVDAEIIIVDWNPPENRPALVDALRLDAPPPHVAVRFIGVPARYHRRLRDWQRSEMCAAVAWNVGIRRARGRFVLPRASDTLLSMELIAFIARRELREDRVYRCCRVDTAPIVLDRISSTDPAALLDACREHAIAEHGFLQGPVFPPMRHLHTNACGDFTLASRTAWRRIRGNREWGGVVALDTDGLALHAMANVGLQQEVLPRTHCVYKAAHGTMTTLNIAEEPLPGVFTLFEGRLIREIDKVHRRLGESSEHLGDHVRFLARLLFDLPRRRYRNLGEIGCPSYTDYLYRAALLSGSASFRSLFFPRRRRLAWEVALRALKVYWQFRRWDEASFGPHRVLRRLVYLVGLALNPRLYRMNGTGWGLKGIQLEERQL